MKQQIFPLGRRDEIVVQNCLDEVFIYDFKSDKILRLNETSSIIWNLCDGTNSVGEISRAVGKKLNSDVSEDLIFLALDQFEKNNLLTNGADETDTALTGISRRKLISRIAMASAVALPLIPSMVAPRAVDANSHLNPPPSGGGTCLGTPCTCSITPILNITTGNTCEAYGGTSNCSGLGTGLCVCQVTSGTNQGTCIGI